ncbi:hypothetical protein D3C75_1242870 [compost metagenome]
MCCDIDENTVRFPGSQPFQQQPAYSQMQSTAFAVIQHLVKGLLNLVMGKFKPEIQILQGFLLRLCQEAGNQNIAVFFGYNEFLLNRSCNGLGNHLKGFICNQRQ